MRDRQAFGRGRGQDLRSFRVSRVAESRKSYTTDAAYQKLATLSSNMPRLKGKSRTSTAEAGAGAMGPGTGVAVVNAAAELKSKRR